RPNRPARRLAAEADAARNVNEDAAGGRVGDGFGEPHLASCARQRGCGGLYARGVADSATVEAIPDPPPCCHRFPLLPRARINVRHYQDSAHAAPSRLEATIARA